MTESTIYNNKVFNAVMPIMLLLAGLYFVPITLFNYDFSKIPGDLGDARFNNYILEHGYQYLTGKIDNYWQGQFMYPYKNVIALSDNLLGTVPIYSFFRMLGIDRETSFQYWFVALFALNYIFCYWSLKKWSGHTILSAVGAYIYAFGLYNHGEIFHAQMFPRFIAPMVIYWLWKNLEENKFKYLVYTCLGIVYQFYCGMYLGFMLIYILIFFLLSYFLVYQKWSYFHNFKNLSTIIKHVALLLICALFFLPLILPYLDVVENMGVRSFDAALNSLPRLRSYFFTSPASVCWNFLYPLSAFKIRDWWNHFLFPGGLSWLAVILIPTCIFSKKIDLIQKRNIIFISTAFFLSIIFCLNVNDYTLYKIIYKIPGFSSMRSMDRIINLQILYFVIVFVFVFKYLINSSPRLKWIVYLLPFLVILENMIQPEPHKSYVKTESQNKIQTIKNYIIAQHNKEKYTAIAYCPIEKYSFSREDQYSEMLETHLNVMLASQELFIPCVNGYTGFDPGNFIDFFNFPGKETIANWAKFNRTNGDRIQIISEIGKVELNRSVINLKTKNNKYLCADENLNDLVVANKDHALSWETFKIIYFEDNLCVIRSHKNLFFSLISQQNNSIAATSSKISQNEIFTIETTNSNEIIFKAANGKYLIVDPNDNNLKANGAHSQNAEKFNVTDFVESK